jgi:hypothetical protein
MDAEKGNITAIHYKQCTRMESGGTAFGGDKKKK